MRMKITFRTTGTCFACRCGVASLSHTRTIKDQFISIWEMSSEENENKIVTKLRRKRVGVRILFQLTDEKQQRSALLKIRAAGPNSYLLKEIQVQSNFVNVHICRSCTHKMLNNNKEQQLTQREWMPTYWYLSQVKNKLF